MAFHILTFSKYLIRIVNIVGDFFWKNGQKDVEKKEAKLISNRKENEKAEGE